MKPDAELEIEHHSLTGITHTCSKRVGPCGKSSHGFCPWFLISMSSPSLVSLFHHWYLALDEDTGGSLVVQWNVPSIIESSSYSRTW